MKAFADVAREALELSRSERLTLARILLEVSEDELDYSPEVEAAWEKEIARRMRDVMAGKAQTSDVDEVFARLDRKLGR